MTISEMISQHWKQTMPPTFPPVDDYAVYLWSKHKLDDVRYAIGVAAEKVVKASSNGGTMTGEAAQKFTSSILRSRTEWRKQRQAEASAQITIDMTQAVNDVLQGGKS